MDLSLIMSRRVWLMWPDGGRFSQPNMVLRVNPAQASRLSSSSLVLSWSQSLDGSITGISKSDANSWMSKRIIQISLNKLLLVKTTGTRPNLEFAQFFNNKSSIKKRDRKLWGGRNLSLLLFFRSLSFYICIWICLEVDKDDERKR